MMSDKPIKLQAKRKNLYLRVFKGHFATSHSHINYYIDVTSQKMRLSEAKAVADELITYYTASTIIDSILCLDGTEVIGACLADKLTRSDFTNMNAHQTIYIVTPEHTSGSQLLFRDNIIQMIAGKHVLILAASVTTGFTALSAIEAVHYYGGHVAGISALFATKEEIGGYPVRSAFDPQYIPDYASFTAAECPLCKRGIKIDALVNSYGCSKL